MSGKSKSISPDAQSRRNVIVDILKRERVSSQAELGELLSKQGHEVTQATLSRDLKALGVGKIPDPETAEGSIYILPGATVAAANPLRNRLELEAFVEGAKLVGNLLLLKTPPGNAHGVGRVVDSMGWEEVAGCIAGDDTVLVICLSEGKARRVIQRIEELSGRRLA